MARKPGDRQKAIVPTLPQMVEAMAKDLEGATAGSERLLDFKVYARNAYDKFNPKFYRFFKSKKRTKVLVGGNQSGKTEYGMVEALIIYTGIIPKCLRKTFDRRRIPTDRPRIVRIVLQDYTKHWSENMQARIEKFLPPKWKENYNSDSHIYTGPDGSILSISSVDPSEKDMDPRKLRSTPADHTWIDETTTEGAYTESLVRGTTKEHGTVTLTYCPQDGFDWTYDRFWLSTHNESNELMPIEERHPDIFCIRVNMRDNPFMSDAAIKAIISTLKPWEIAYRVDGYYSQRTGDPYFDWNMLNKWRKAKSWSWGSPHRFVNIEVDAEAGIWEGRLQGLSAQPDETLHHVWYIWEMPQDRHKYIASADVAEGNPKSDYCSCTIWDATDHERPYQVARLHKRIRASAFADQCLLMCTIYGKCTFIPERNATGGGVVIERAKNYDSIYTQRKIGDIQDKQTQKLGWETTTWTKEPMLSTTYDYLKAMDKIGHIPFNDRRALDEFQIYQEKIERDKNDIAKTTWGAPPGSFDDIVIDNCIGLSRIMNESDLLTAFVEPKVEEKPYQHNHLEKKANSSQGRAFSGLRKRPTLADLRKKSSRRP